jgi:hypothetical protein
MASSKQPITFEDLYTDLMNRAREETGLAATKTQAKRYINIALHDMHIGQGEKLPWAEQHATLVTQPQYSTGTVAITKGSKLLTGTDTLWATNNDFSVANMREGGKIKIDGGDEIYEVDVVSVDTVALLKTSFVKADVSGASYVYYEDEYDLASDFLRPIDQQKFDEGISIDLVGRTEFRRRYPRNSIPNKPRVGTIVDRTQTVPSTGSITAFSDNSSGGQGIGGTAVSAGSHSLSGGETVAISGTSNYDGIYQITRVSGSSFLINATYVATETGTWTRTISRNRRLILHPPPSAADMIPYNYVTSNLAVGSANQAGINSDTLRKEQLENDNDEPIVPLRYRHAIVFHALSHWYRDKKDDQRSQAVANEYVNLMTRIIGDTEIGGAHAQIRPNISRYRSRAKRPWGGGSSRYDTNGAFDRLEK